MGLYMFRFSTKTSSCQNFQSKEYHTLRATVLGHIANRDDLHTSPSRHAGVCGLLRLSYVASALSEWEFTDSNSFFRVYSVNGGVCASVCDDSIVHVACHQSWNVNDM